MGACSSHDGGGSAEQELRERLAQLEVSDSVSKQWNDNIPFTFFVCIHRKYFLHHLRLC